MDIHALFILKLKLGLATTLAKVKTNIQRHTAVKLITSLQSRVSPHFTAISHTRLKLYLEQSNDVQKAY